MFSILKKFQVWTALAGSGELPERLAGRLSSDPGLRRYAETSRELVQRLKESVPQKEFPAGLHEQIMRSLHATPEPTRPFWFPLRFALGAGFVVLLLLAGGWLATRQFHSRPFERSVNTTALAAADTVLAAGANLSRNAPAAMVGPVSQELEFLQRDFHSAAERLVASLP